MHRWGNRLADNPLIHDIDELRAALLEDPDLRDLVASIPKIQNAVSEIWRTPHHSWFTDHGPDHSRRVATYALQLALLPSLHPSFRLSPLEVFVLWSAAWLHDVGMQDLRATGQPIGQMSPSGYDQVRHEHPNRSSENILTDWAQFGLPENDPPLAELVASVARAHGTKYYRETVRDRLQDSASVRNQPVRARLLAALLLFADELDLHYQRAVPPSGWSDNNAISEAHSFKHKCVVAVNPVCQADGRIAVELELKFPSEFSEEQREIIRQWIEIKLLKQMGMIEPEITAGFNSQASFDRIIRTTVGTTLAQTPILSDAALAVIRADTTRDQLINHQRNLELVQKEVDNNGIVVLLPGPEGHIAPHDDGQTDLIEAVIAATEAGGRRVCVSRRGAFVLGATAGDIMKEWILCLAPESADDHPTADEQNKASDLDRLVNVITRLGADQAYLFAIAGGEYVDIDDLAWIANTLVPALRECCGAVAFALTLGLNSTFTAMGAARLAVPMSDLSPDDIADYLRRFVREDVALAESHAHDSYTRVKLQGQRHLIAQRR